MLFRSIEKLQLGYQKDLSRLKATGAERGAIIAKMGQKLQAGIDAAKQSTTDKLTLIDTKLANNKSSLETQKVDNIAARLQPSLNKITSKYNSQIRKSEAQFNKKTAAIDAKYQKPLGILQGKESKYKNRINRIVIASLGGKFKHTLAEIASSQNLRSKLNQLTGDILQRDKDIADLKSKSKGKFGMKLTRAEIVKRAASRPTSIEAIKLEEMNKRRSELIKKLSDKTAAVAPSKPA